MTQEMVLEIATKAIYTMLLVSGPILLVGLIVGLVISIFQTVTSIHEQTLTFIPKILAEFLTLIILGPWMMEKVISFTSYIFNSISTFSK